MTKCEAAASTGCVTLVQPAGEANDAKSLHSYPVTRSILEHAQTVVARLSLPPPPLIEPGYEARAARAETPTQHIWHFAAILPRLLNCFLYSFQSFLSMIR